MVKSNKEVIQEIVDIIFDKLNDESGGNKIMFMPVINIVKLKLSNMDDDDGAFLVDTVHKISHHIEKETGQLSPYHCIENDTLELND